MLCYKNGALAREMIRDLHAGSDWATFNHLVEATPPGNHGYIGLYYPLPEIIPPNIQGDFLFFSQDSGTLASVDSIPSTCCPRAVLESQLLSVLSHITDILPDAAPPLRRLIVSGGSSVNETILQMAADILGLSVFVIDDGSASAEAACMGAAKLAAYALRREVGHSTRFQNSTFRSAIQPRDPNTQMYRELLDVYRLAENEAVRIYETGNTNENPKV